MLLPAWTGLGEATLVTDRLGPEVPTIVLTVAELLAEFGSETDEVTWALPVMIVPLAKPAFTFTVIVNVLVDDPPARFASVQTRVPVFPVFGFWQLHPAGASRETNVVFVGTGTIRAALSAAL